MAMNKTTAASSAGESSKEKTAKKKAVKVTTKVVDDGKAAREFSRKADSLVRNYEKSERGYSEKTGKYTSKDKATIREEKKAFIEEHFHPTAVEWLKKNFAIDLYSDSIDKSTVYDICVGNMTKPMPITVTPIGYDWESKKNFEGKPITVNCSMMFKFPHVKDGKQYKPAALVDTDKKKVLPFFQSFPVYPYLEMATPEEINESVDNTQSEGRDSMIEFTPAQKSALSAIGVSGDNLYPNNRLAYDYDTRRAIAEGEEFSIRGKVNTSVGMVNVAGIGRMVVTSKGNVLTDFVPNEIVSPKDRSETDALDIIPACTAFDVDYCLYEKDKTGKPVLDMYGGIKLTKAGEELVAFGYALQPVEGFRHLKDGKIEKNYYQMSVVNGGLFGKKFESLEDGTLQIPDVRLAKDNTLQVGAGPSRQILKFEDEKQLQNYLAGKGGFVENAKHTTVEYKDGKALQTTVEYRGFVIADNQKCGFAKLFDPDMSRKIEDYLSTSVKKVVKKKQNYSRHI